MNNDNRIDNEEVDVLMRNSWVFREEYNYWRDRIDPQTKIPNTHPVATRHAIDYYRKFTQYESTVDWQRLVDLEKEDDQANDIIETIQFNEVVTRMLGELTNRQKELFSYIILQQDLDQYLNKENYAVIKKITKGKRPTEIKDIAKYMKLKLNSIGVCTPITNMRKRIRDIFTLNGFSPNQS